MAGDAAQNAANKVNPSEDQLSQIDQPAEDNTWHEAPNLSKDNLKSQVQSKVPFSKKDAQDAAGDATQAAHPSGERDPATAADSAANAKADGASTGMDGKEGAKAGAKNLKSRMDENMSDDQKQRARETRERTENYFKGKMPKERREQVIWRLKKMVVEVQGHQDCMLDHPTHSTQMLTDHYV